jgi:hypothetical protein
MGRSRALHGIHLRVRVGESGAVEGRTVAAPGRGAPAWNRVRGKAGGRGKSGWRESSPQCGASGALPRRQEAVARRAAKAQRQWRRRLGLHEQEAMAAGLTAVGHGGGALNRAAAALACGPGAPRGGCPCWSRV